MNITRQKAQYRKQGILEYLIHLKTGTVITASPFMRVDTFNYRNEQLKSKGLRWFVDPTYVKEFANIPGGILRANDHIWFRINNLVWDKEHRVLSNSRLKYFDGISSHNIKITGVTGKVITFDKNIFEKIKKDGTDKCIHQLTWTSKETDIRFILAWEHVDNGYTKIVKPIL